MQKATEQRICSKCEKLVSPIRLGRANYQCPICKNSMMLEMVFQYQAIQEALDIKKEKASDSLISK
jgi:hypothetical protein